MFDGLLSLGPQDKLGEVVDIVVDVIRVVTAWYYSWLGVWRVGAGWCWLFFFQGPSWGAMWLRSKRDLEGTIDNLVGTVRNTINNLVGPEM